MYGKEGSVVVEPVDDESMEKCLEAFDQALADIPVAQKTEYLEALQVPSPSPTTSFVELESPALTFLRAERFDAKAAASRLVHYWKLRKDTFQDKALLQMTMEGALRDDLQIMSLGYMAILPNDRTGRPCFYFDQVRCLPVVASPQVFVRTCNFSLEPELLRWNRFAFRGAHTMGIFFVLCHNFADQNLLLSHARLV